MLYHLILSGNLYGSEIRHGIFFGLILWSRNGLVLLEALGLFWAFLFSPSFDHPRHLKSGVLPWACMAMVLIVGRIVDYGNKAKVLPKKDLKMFTK